MKRGESKMGRKERRHSELGPMKIVPPFGDRSWFTPESRIARVGTGKPESSIRRDQKGVKRLSFGSIILFLGIVGSSIAILGILLKWIF